MQSEEDAPISRYFDHTTGRESITCEECGGIYEKPIVAHIISTDEIQDYYACPRCMTKASRPQVMEEQPKPAPVTQTKRTPIVKNETVIGCPNEFGYLKKHGRDKPIPEECLTCSRIMDCLK